MVARNLEEVLKTLEFEKVDISVAQIRVEIAENTDEELSHVRRAT